MIDRRTIVHTGLVNAGARARAVSRTYQLQVLAEPAQTAALGARPVLIGAHASCDVVLTDAQVSRKHAELTALPDGVRVRDLGSTNGTWWQGARITEVVVTTGSTVTFGTTPIRISAGPAPVVPPSPHDRFGAMVGTSVAMRELFAVLELAGPSDATVLVEGESGTGKELAARAIHDASARAAGPFVVVDCSALTESLLDSHLFGHVKGAFTGAERERKGAFVEASGGTLFLDELGELPLPAQAKLLRALEAQTVQPVGADRPVAVDTRVVAATHRDLAGMVARKDFRFDLFYRLAVVHVVLPPLRERLEDLPALVAAFYAGRGRTPGPIDGDNLALLRQHAWPGNVRELRNVLDRAWAMSPDPAFRALRLSTASGPAPGFTEVVDTSLAFKDAKERWNDHFERRYLTALFTATGGNLSRAATQAGLSRRHFRELLYKHGIVARPADGADDGDDGDGAR
ncbi:MAG: sigma 54-interacting transcriptional regulator [Kofleriaceae bacterium]|nr:sigma 54-interacting transcriptional regulator [Kofleriaceae bacterium]MBP9206998.1 sigma 54-interacting transcriptional regulator [Kofleriaceae bacterium]